MPKHLFIMDPLDSIVPAKDTSSLLIKAGLKRGHEIHIAELSGLLLTPQFLKVTCQQVRALDIETGYDLHDTLDQFADDFDVIWLRKDPPFDETYLAHLSLFDHLTNDKVLFVNDPGSIRELNEKLTIFEFPEYIVDTIVTIDQEVIKKFWETHGKIVIKSLVGFSGQEVEMISEWKDDVHKLDTLSENGKRFVMAQKFIGNVYFGDKRVYLLDGEILGEMLRVPQGSFKGNLHAGGRAEATTLNEHEREISTKVAKFLAERGVILAGIDLIDGYLTEINVTSPGVMIGANRVSGRHMEEDIWNLIENKLV